MPKTQRLLKVFLSYASQDKSIVQELSQRLASEGWIDPWVDEKKLLPGEDWRLKIEEAVETSDIVIICLSSNSVTKEGYVQKELRYAREIALEKPEQTIFLIPLRLDNCDVPRGLRFYQWADYFGEKKDQTYKALLKSLKLRHNQKLKLEEEQRARQEKERLKRELDKKIVQEKAKRETKEKAAKEEAKPKVVENKVDETNESNADSSSWFNAYKAELFGDPVKLFGYVLAFVLFAVFLYADSVAIANTLVLMGLISPDLPNTLQRLDLSIMAGVVLAPVVGIRTISETSGKGELFVSRRMSKSQKSVFKFLSIALVICSFSGIAIILTQKLISLRFLQSTSTIDMILSFTLLGILSIDTSYGAALTFQSAASGMIATTYLLVDLVRLAIRAWQR